ncbi:MAG TPA: pilus assembly protein [Actinotalea sp.]|nr:pilus assembly protein [Actinotalea sp.]
MSATTAPSTGRRDDAGSAVVEFLGVALVLLVPVVYLVLVLGRFQSAAFAVEGAAREAVRAYVTTTAHDRSLESLGEPAPAARPADRALTAVGLALADQGLDAPPAQVLTLTCAPDCTGPRSRITAAVQVDVPLPGVPAWLQPVVPLSVPVAASAMGSLDGFGGAG